MTRVRTMMRNHRIFQSLGIGALASLLKIRTVVEEGSTNTNDDSASAITQGESSDYNPKEDEVIDGEEVDDILVEKTVKDQKVSRRKKAAVKKTSHGKRSIQAAATMGPGRVRAENPEEAAKRLLETDGTTTARVTSKRLSKPTPTIHHETLLPMDRQSSSERDDELLSRDQEATTTHMAEGRTVLMDLRPVAPSLDRNGDFCEEQEQANFEVEAESHIIHSSCTDMLQKISKNMRYRIKKDFFDPIPANELTIKSPVEGLPDAEWQALLKLWATPRHKDAPPPEGQAPKSDLEIVVEVLKEDVKQSTFLVNVGLQSRKKPRANNAFVAAHVRDLEEKLERSELQTEVMREEVAAIKKRAEEAEAAQAARDRDYELLRKQTEEQDAKLAHLMALFGS
ncbi:unnamed protein product [Alopecurus aequalis]